MCFTNLPSLGLPLLGLCLVATATSCSLLPKKEVVKNPLPEGAWWSHGQSEGEHKIVISLEEQRVALFRDDKPVGVSPISSGKEGHSTHAGTYKITEKDPDHRSSYYGAYCDESGQIVVEDVDVRKDPQPPGTTFVGADMQHFMRINGPIGMHRGYLPGYPASHGCIRLPGTMAALFFSATPEGTPVEIKDHAGLAELKTTPESETLKIVESNTQPAELKASITSEAPKLPEQTKVVATKKGSGLPWFATAKKPTVQDLKIAPVTEPKKDIKTAVKKSWFASLNLPKTEEPATIKTVTTPKPRPEPVELSASPEPVAAPKISPPKTMVMATPKPLAQQISTQKVTKPKPGQTLYWNGN